MDFEKTTLGHTMLIGYARVSTEDQSLDLQRDALEQAGCEQIYSDKLSGAKIQRPGLAEALSHLRKGDVLVIWKLDRLGRSVKRLVDLVEELAERGVQFRSLTDGIDVSLQGDNVTWVKRCDELTSA